MKRIVGLLIFLSILTPPAWAQGKSAAQRGDPCAPIGKTSDGRFVYSLACEAIPTPMPVAPRPAAEAPPPPPPPVEEDKGGLFRNPFPSLIRPTNTERQPGVGPSGGGR